MTIVDRDLTSVLDSTGRVVFQHTFQRGGAEDVLMTALIPVGTSANPAPGGINQGDSVGSVYRIWKDTPAMYRPVELTVQNNFVDATLELDFGIYGSTSRVSGNPEVLNQNALASNLTFAAERAQGTPLILVGPNPITNTGRSLREMIPQDLFQEQQTAQNSGGYDLTLTMTAAPTALPAFTPMYDPYNNLIPLAFESPLTPPFGQVALTTITNANPAEVTTSVAHNLTTGQYVYLNNVLGMPQINGQFYRVTVIDGTHFTLANVAGTAIDSSAYGTYTSGGYITLVNNYIVMTLELIREA